MTNQEIKDMLKRYNAGTCTEQERGSLDDWFFHLGTSSPDLSAEDIDAMDDHIQKNLGIASKPHRLWPILTVAASIALVAIASFFYTHHKHKDAIANTLVHIQPGSHKATLTLSNGNLVDLSDVNATTLAKNSGLHIQQNSNGALVYEGASPASEKASNAYNTITTPRGGQYQITLPDGTKIWLNAASMVKYPVHFGNRIREVTVGGEAYLEVAKDIKRPFIVHSGAQRIEVLGTHFNVNTYDPMALRTTLFEGVVKVNSNILKPGKQAINVAGSINIVDADLDLEMAWKNGKIEFSDASIETVMDLLSRWYDFQPVYIGEKPKALFSASVSRSKDIQEILRLLEFTQSVQFKIIGRRVEIREK